jgi:predicted Zn-dependent protease
MAYFYAKDIVNGRWPEGEEAISKDPRYADKYAKDVVKGRWPEGEGAISKNPEYADAYL